MPDRDLKIRAQILRALHWLEVATVVLYVGLILAGIYIYTESRNNHDALCNLRSDLQRRVVGLQDLLAKHPQGALGISRADIELSIRNTQRTVNALQPLNCKQPKQGE